MDNVSMNSGRRKFVKTSSKVLAGSTLLSSAPFISFGNPQSQLKIGLIGCGGRGTGAAYEALKASSSVKLVAMGETFDDRLNSSYQRLKSSFSDQVDVPESHRFIGFDAFEKVIDKCDAVILTTPAPFRPIHFEAAVNADKHVFMEKPLFVDIPGYHKIIQTNEIAKRKGLKVAVGLQYRFETKYQQMIEKIKEGVIGSIHSLNVYYNVAAPKCFPRQKGQSEMNFQMRNWRYFTWLWGGQLAGQTIHQIDVANWLMDDYPISVNGLGGRISFHGPDQGNTYDHHYAEFEYANKIKMHTQCRTIDNNWNKTGFQFQGTTGYADEKGRIFDASGKIIWRYRDRDNTVGSSQMCQSAFINAIIEDKILNHVHYGANSTLTTIMGRMAIHSGKVFTREEVLKSTKSLLPKEFSWDADMPDIPGTDGNYAIPIPGQTDVL